MAPVLELYQQAAKLGSAEAQNELGEIYMTGEGGLTPNFTLAVAHFNSSAGLGFERAQYNLGVAWSLGLGVPEQDDAMAVLNYFFASAGGSHEAKMALVRACPLI